MNPDLDLTLQRVIRAPRETVWHAWTDPSHLERWWVPAPTVVRIDRLDVRPGGAFVTRVSDDGVEFVPHVAPAVIGAGRRLLAHPSNSAGLRLTHHDATPAGLLLLEYDTTGAAPVAHYEGVTAHL